MTGRRTQGERREATRAALLRAGRESFTESGYHEASQEEIVSRAGMTRGALYHNFDGGKRGLFREVVEEIQVEMDEAISAAFEEEYEQSEDAVEAWLAGTLAYLRMCGRTDVRRLLFGDASAVLGWDEWREIDEEHSLGPIREGFEEMIEAGILARQPVGPLAHIWHGASVEAGIYVSSAEDTEAAVEEMQVAFRRVLGGMLG